MNLDIIKQILMSDVDYWVLAKKNYSYRFGKQERGDDDIIFVALPRDVPRDLKYDEITLKHIEHFDSLFLDCNIFLNEPYAPFQRGIRFYDIHNGFPIIGDIKQFVIKALQIEKGDLYTYKTIAQQLVEPNETS